MWKRNTTSHHAVRLIPSNLHLPFIKLKSGVIGRQWSSDKFLLLLSFSPVGHLRSSTNLYRRTRKVDKINYDITVKRCPCSLDGTSLPLQVCSRSCEMCLRDRHTPAAEFQSSLGTSFFQNSGNHNLNRWRDSGSSIWTSNRNVNKGLRPNSRGSNTRRNKGDCCLNYARFEQHLGTE